MSARHSRVKSSTIVRIRKRRPSLTAQLSDEEWEKKYSLPAPALKSVQ
jgi:hypothetical protein